MTGTDSTSRFDPHPAEGRTLGATAKRSSLVVGLAKAIRYTFVLVVQLLLMNLLGPTEFGLMRYVTIVLTLINLINTAGLSVAVVQKERIDASEIGPVFLLNVLSSLTLFAGVWVGAPLVAGFFHESRLVDLLRVGALAIPLGGISIVHRGLLERRFKYTHLSVIEAVSAAVGSLTSVALAASGFGVWSLVWGTIAFNALSSGLVIACQPGVRPAFSGFGHVAVLFVFGLGWTAQRFIEFATGNIDNLIVGKQFGSTALGIYSIAYDLCTLPSTILAAILMSVAMSLFSRIHKDPARLQQAYLSLTLLVALAATPYLVVAGTMSSDAVRAITAFVPGDTWIPAAELMRFLAPMGLVYAFSSLPGALWAAQGRIDVQIYWVLAMLTTAVVAVIIGARFGPVGVCLAMLIRAVVQFPFLLVVCKRVGGISPAAYLRSLLPPVVCGAGMAAVCLGVARLVPAGIAQEYVVRITAAAGAGTATYAMMLFAFFRREWRAVVGFIRIGAGGQ